MRLIFTLALILWLQPAFSQIIVLPRYECIGNSFQAYGCHLASMELPKQMSDGTFIEELPWVQKASLALEMPTLMEISPRLYAASTSRDGIYMYAIVSPDRDRFLILASKEKSTFFTEQREWLRLAASKMLKTGGAFFFATESGYTCP